jgi:hypothetical protein
MDYNFVTISIKRFLIIYLFWIIIFVVTILYLDSLKDITTNELLFGVEFFLVFIIGFIVAFRFSIKRFKLHLTESTLIIGTCIIKLSDIRGYYINTESLLMKRIEFKDSNKSYSISSVNYRGKGKDFDLFVKEFVEKCSEANTDIKEFSFYDFHKKQYTFFKTSIYITITVIILLNLLYLYLIIVKKFGFDWRIIFLNFSIIILYNFHKRNEKLYKNQ